MMVDHALALAEKGFHVFRVKVNGKTPARKGWQEEATRDPEQIKKLWGKRAYNVGIFTSKFGDDKALVVVDIDTKEGKHGDDTILELDLAGKSLPITFEQSTPSGGRHLIYISDQPIKQGTNSLGSGVDIRSRGGLILGPGSRIGDLSYAQINGYSRLAPVPEWVVNWCGRDDRPRNPGHALPGVDRNRARDRAVDWLKNHAPLAVENSGGDQTTFAVACQLKEFGCDEDQALGLMWSWWNDRCSPPWDDDDLERKVANAYRYSQNPQGSLAPEAVFAPTDGEPPSEDVGTHPFDKMNEEFAFVKRGCFILQETTDEKGRFCIERLDLKAFNTWHKNKPMTIGDKTRPVSDWWLESPRRRQYDGVTFSPGKTVDARFYNLWRGFRTEPKPGAHPAVETFKEHALLNVCNGDKRLFNWLMGYFAHMIQKPWEKPLVALVFKGRKGTGKNALVERVGWLLGGHSMVADDERYLLSNFNAHMENKLFLTLDEAAWAGDKKAESRLKGLITGSEHVIERKGQEIYTVDNLTRVAIIGNEEWLVPASVDERRFAVFNLGEGRMQDRKFFEDMRIGLEKGGYAHLLSYFQEFDLSTVDVNEAPQTAGLTEQKLASLEIPQAWWLECLSTGQIAGGDWGGEWPAAVPTNRLRMAITRWMRERNVRSRFTMTDVALGRLMAKMAPHFHKKKTERVNPEDTSYSYHSPGLEVLREDFERYVGGAVEWS